MPKAMAALLSRARTFQRQEWEAQRLDGRRETIDHEQADAQVLAKLEGEDEDVLSTWHKLAMERVVGEARGAERNAQGPQVRRTDDGQLRMARTPDVLLRLSDTESAYLGELVKRSDAARINAAIQLYDGEAKEKRHAAEIASTRTSGLLEILGDILRGDTIAWDEPETMADAAAA